MAIKLRPYQEEVIIRARKSISQGKKRIALVLGCGAGKSVIAGNIARNATDKRNTVMFLVHRRELCQQIEKTFRDCGVDFDYCTINMVQTLCRRTHKIAAPKLIICDECFVKDTLVDNIPIQHLRRGMKILCFDENGNIYSRKILSISKRRAPDKLFKIVAGENEIICTGHHPIFTKTGWVCAENLRKGDLVYGINMRKMRRKEKRREGNIMRGLLSKKNDTTQQRNISGTDEDAKSDANAWDKRKSKCNIKSYRTQTEGAWRERNGYNCTTKDVKRSAKLGNGICCCNACSQDKSNEISITLQDRYSECRKENCYRSGWEVSWCDESTIGRQKEKRFFRESRVESVEVYQRTDTNRFASVCPDGYVYNVEVEQHHTYFANNIAVHNCHHILSNSYTRILNAFPNAIVVGVTATPIRMNEGGLGKVFEELIEGVSTKWLIDNHYLAPYKYYGVTLADTSRLHTRNGDYDKAEVEELMSQNYIFGSAVENWKKYANGQKTIVYCSSINTSKETVRAFQEAGVKAEHLDGTTPKAERERIVNEFREGLIDILSNVDLFGEGMDVPDCVCSVLLRPTKSIALAIQQQMRCMRYQEGKTAIILDHVGVYRTAGLPDDPRTWTLEGRQKREKATITVRECRQCFAVNPANATVCKYCGAELSQPKTEKDKKIVEDILLEEIKARPYDDYKKCKTWEEIDRFRKAKKYHFRWGIRKAQELGIEIPKKYRRLIYWYGGGI